METINNVINWLYQFVLSNKLENQSNIENKQITAIKGTIIKQISSLIIFNYPDFNEYIEIITPNLSLGNYVLLLPSYEIPMVKIELQRISEGYVLVKISDREVLWDIVDNIVFSDNVNDINYWSKDLNIQVKSCNEFTMRTDEIISLN